MNFPWGALARLGLARAYAIQGDTAKAKACISGFPHPLERRRSRHPHPESKPRRSTRSCSSWKKSCLVVHCLAIVNVSQAVTLRTGVVGQIATKQLFQDSWVCKYLFGFFFREVPYDPYDGERIRAALAAFAGYPGRTR